MKHRFDQLIPSFWLIFACHGRLRDWILEEWSNTDSRTEPAGSVGEDAREAADANRAKARCQGSRHP